MTDLSTGASALLQQLRDNANYGENGDETYLQEGDLTPEQNGFLTHLKKLELVELVADDEDQYGRLTFWYRVSLKQEGA